MPQISHKKREKIQEQILNYLFEVSPEPIFTSKIAEAIARDEEFTKSILNELKNKNLIIEINKNPSGIKYKKRQRWRLSNKTFKVFKSFK